MTDWAAWSREAVAMMNARNERWQADFAVEPAARFEWDLTAGTIRFARQRDDVVADLCMVGSATVPGERFEWAWADPSIPSAAQRKIDRVRAFGAEHDLPLLTTPVVPGGEAQGKELVAVAGRVLDAAGVFVDHIDDMTLFFTLSAFRVEPR